MSPINTAATRGYPDWRRIDDYDTGVIYSKTGVSGTAPINSGVLDVSRYGYLAGYINETQSGCLVTVKWFTDQAGTNQIGQQQFFLNFNISFWNQLRIPNLGPYVSIQAVKIGAAAFTFSAQIIATNRVHPLQSVPQYAANHDNQSVVFAAGVSTWWPSNYYAGPMTVYVHGGGAASNVQIQVPNSFSSFDVFWSVPFLTAATDYVWNTIAPMGAWNITINNGSGAAMNGCVLVTTPSWTGSS